MAAPPYELTPDQLACLRAGLRLMALQRLADVEAAEEVAQESLARLLAAVREGRLEHPAKLGAFARAIAYHVIVDTIRARSRHQPIATVDHRLAAAGPDPLSLLLSGEEKARVRAALVTLSSADRELLRLCFFDGLAPADLAGRLNQPADRIRKRKQRALERLRRALLGLPGHGTGPSPTREGEPGMGPARFKEAE